MSVCGIDFGSETMTIAIARRGGIDIIANEVSNRYTPSMITFNSKDRCLGETAKTEQMRYFKNSIWNVKELIGKSWEDESAQEIIKKLPQKFVKLDDGGIGFIVRYRNEETTFSIQQLLGMLLTKCREIVALHGQNVKDTVISVPNHWNDKQRHAIFDAAKLAGFNVLQLMNETTAVGMGYGIVKTDLPEGDNPPRRVAIVSLGHASSHVSILNFKKGKLTVLSHATNPNLGGRNFDERLFNHFCDEFKNGKYKLDVASNGRATLRLMKAVNKLKTTLSSIGEAPMNIESLMDDMDVTSSYTREAMETLCADLYDGIKELAEKAMRDAISAHGEAPLYAVEIVGGTSRMPTAKKILKDFFKIDLSTTMNAAEAVARGCALQAAVLSPAFRVREFGISDICTNPVKIEWTGHVDEHNPVDGENSIVLFNKGAARNVKGITFYKSSQWDIKSTYADSGEEVSKHTILLSSKNNEIKKVKVKCKINGSGLFVLDNAQIIEEFTETVEEEVPLDEAELKEAQEKAGEGEEVPKTKKVSKERKRIKRTEVKVSSTSHGMIEEQLKAALKFENDMQEYSNLIRNTEEKKNSVESYVYEYRGKIRDGGEFYEFISDTDREKFLNLLNDTENWLYEDGDDVELAVYNAKLDELTTFGAPVKRRFVELNKREEILRSIQSSVVAAREFIADSTEKYDHISSEQRAELETEAKDLEKSVSDATATWAKENKSVDTTILVQDLLTKKVEFDLKVGKVKATPKPKPPKEEEKKEEKKEESEKEEDNKMDID